MSCNFTAYHANNPLILPKTPLPKLNALLIPFLKLLHPFAIRYLNSPLWFAFIALYLSYASLLNWLYWGSLYLLYPLYVFFQYFAYYFALLYLSFSSYDEYLSKSLPYGMNPSIISVIPFAPSYTLPNILPILPPGSSTGSLFFKSLLAWLLPILIF